MDDIIEESESTAEERPECAVSYRYKVYRRPDLNHPVILRVRDYEHEVLESRGGLPVPAKCLTGPTGRSWSAISSRRSTRK